jgi:hypothetical protein
MGFAPNEEGSMYHHNEYEEENNGETSIDNIDGWLQGSDDDDDDDGGVVNQSNPYSLLLVRLILNTFIPTINHDVK